MTTKLNLAELDALAELEAKATKGPWLSALVSVEVDDGHGSVFLNHTHDARFCLAARNAVPELIRELREARVEVERLKGLVKLVEHGNHDNREAGSCPWCGADKGEPHDACITFDEKGNVR